MAVPVGFKKKFTSQQINKRVDELAKEIKDQFGQQDIVLLTILRGAAPFAVDLGRALQKIGVDVAHEYVQISSYGSGMQSSGEPQLLGQLPAKNLAGKKVLIVDDILETGHTLDFLQSLVKKQAKSADLAIAVLLAKPASMRKVKIEAKFIGFEIDDIWVSGYGIDTGGQYRNYPNIFYKVSF